MALIIPVIVLGGHIREKDEAPVVTVVYPFCGQFIYKSLL